jgi:hypothetical protein
MVAVATTPSVVLWITRVRMPETDIGVLNLVRALVPRDTRPEKTLMALGMLACYKGETVAKAMVKDAIADALGTYVYQIEWPVGWRRVDWCRSLHLHHDRSQHARRRRTLGHALYTFHLDSLKLGAGLPVQRTSPSTPRPSPVSPPLPGHIYSATTSSKPH